MSWKVRILTQVPLLALAALVLIGCPQGTAPVLSVSPLAINFGPNTSAGTIRISNSGGGELQWRAEESLPWIELSLKSNGKQASDAIEGSVATGTDVVQVQVLRDQLPLGLTTGTISITSNGGSATVNLSVSQTGPAVLQVDPLSVDFGLNLQAATISISNGGSETLEWSIAVPSGQDWLDAAPVQGTVVSGGPSSIVTFTVDRSALSPGAFSLAVPITSNGGNASVNVAVDVAPFEIDPVALDFGRVTTAETQMLAVLNRDLDPLDVSFAATTVSGGNWLSVTPPDLTVPAESDAQAAVTVNAAGLAPGMYQGQVTVSDGAFELVAPVVMRVASFSVSTSLLDFGELSAESSLDFTLNSVGSASIPFTISVPSSDQDWLSVAPVSGTLNGEVTVTATVNPLAVAPGDYESEITIDFDGDPETVTVRMTRLEPASLQVSPRTIDFGTNRVEELVAIWNPGIGAVSWSIDTADFPDWLALEPVDGNGIASGSVSGEQTDQVIIRVDRTAAPINQFEFEHQFTVTATGDSDEDVLVTVRMRVARVPVIEIDADGIDERGVNFVNFDVDIEQKQFVIRNEGTGVLSWSIDLEDAPDWIASVSPSQGSLDPFSQQIVTITVDRSGLSFLGAQFELVIDSNDPERGALPLLVEVQVAKRVAIASRQSSVSFGASGTTTEIEVGNVGDPGTVLNFLVIPSKEWLSVYPESGTSQGPVGIFIDWQLISVTVDRSLLDGAGASAVLTIVAFTIENGQPVPLDNVAPVEVPVTVEAEDLTIESARPRTRIPSMLRYVLMMRNVRFQALPIPASRLEEVGQQFVILEDSTPLERTETSQFLRPPDGIKSNTLILLDYSGSMQAAAQELVAAGELNNGQPIADALQLLYDQTIPTLIDELPAQYRVALGIFNERSNDPETKVRILESQFGEPRFTTNRDDLKDRLARLAVVDNGATELLPAIEHAARIVVHEDETFLFPFDDADVKSIICVTDGRLTTPPGEITETSDLLEGLGVRLFAVGWGTQVASNPLVRMARVSGGHVYSTRNVPTGELDQFNRPIRRPQFVELMDWMETDLLDECDQSISKDLKSQVVLSYVSLNEEPNVPVEVGLTFNDPNDQSSVCLPEQGTISGSVTHTQIDLFSARGDVRLGQIALHSLGVQPDGSAEVLVRGDYMPRNVTSFTFQMSASAEPFTVTQVPATEGGIISDWIFSRAGDLYTYTSPDGTPLVYGEYGSLLRIRWQAVAAPILLLFEVIAPAYNTADPEASKFFTHPDSIFIEAGEEVNATSFPRPLIVPGFDPSTGGQLDPVSTDPWVFDVGSRLDIVELGVANLGGSHVILDEDGDVDVEKSVVLEWFAEGTGIVNLQPASGFVASTSEVDFYQVRLDRSQPPGDYIAEVLLTYSYGNINITERAAPIQIRYTIEPTTIFISNSLMQLGSLVNSATFDIENRIQQDNPWEINTAMPSWLSVNPTSGVLTATGSTSIASVTVSVDRTGLSPGDYSHVFLVEVDNGADLAVGVRMTVP